MIWGLQEETAWGSGNCILAELAYHLVMWGRLQWWVLQTMGTNEGYWYRDTLFWKWTWTDLNNIHTWTLKLESESHIQASWCLNCHKSTYRMSQLKPKANLHLLELAPRILMWGIGTILHGLLWFLIIIVQGKLRLRLVTSWRARQMMSYQSSTSALSIGLYRSFKRCFGNRHKYLYNGVQCHYKVSNRHLIHTDTCRYSCYLWSLVIFCLYL